VRVAVIGAGNIGGTLGRKWVAAGHDVRFGVASPGKYDDLRAAGATVGDVHDAVDGADAVVLAVPGAAVPDVLAQAAPALGGAVVVDATNNVGGGGALNASAAVATVAPGAAYVRAFSTLGWENFATPTYAGGERADLFYAGPDGAPQRVVEQLIEDVGLRPVRVGGPDQVETIDGVTRLWFALVMGQHRPRHTAFRVLGDEVA
jgi:predicted dinucleotide-binding enzyme